jgi:hypothetical protein
MSTASSNESNVTHDLIDQRLDAIDRALMGLVSRTDRQSLVADLEVKIRQLASASPCDAEHRSDDEGSGPGAPRLIITDAGHSPFRQIPPAGKQRSRLAVTSGVLGIVAIGLLVMAPVTFGLLSMIEGAVDETILMAVMGSHVVALSLAGLAAVAAGGIALLRFRKLERTHTGHGWAIAGMCTGAMPMFLGCLGALIAGLELGSEFMTETVPAEAVADADDDSTTKPTPRHESVAHVEPQIARPEDSRPLIGTPVADDEPGRAVVRQVGNEAPVVIQQRAEENSKFESLPTPTPRPESGTQPTPIAPSPAPKTEPQPEPPSKPETAPAQLPNPEADPFAEGSPRN